jgi:hypothetical protein
MEEWQTYKRLVLTCAYPLAPIKWVFQEKLHPCVLAIFVEGVNWCRSTII